MMSKNKKIARPKHAKQSSGHAHHITKKEVQRITRLLLEEQEDQVLSYKQVCYAFGKTTMAQKRTIYHALQELSEAGELQELEPGRGSRRGYAWRGASTTVRGVRASSPMIPSWSP